MRILGIAVQKNYLRYSILEGTKAAPALIKKGRYPTTSPDEVPQLMDWFETQFEHLITQYKPNKIAYKLTLEPKLEQIHCLSFPLGILNLIAHQKEIPVVEYSTKAITTKKLGLPKTTDLYRHVDATLGSHPPYWDSIQKDAILVAWFSL